MEQQSRIKTHHGAMGDLGFLIKGQFTLEEYLEKYTNKPKKAGNIYIHIPFCAKTCSFCSLNRIEGKTPEHYHELILKDIEFYSSIPYIKQSKYDAIYFGGGTPTTLSAHAMKLILSSLKKNFNLSDDVEITIESSVSELTDDKIEILKEMGVNRLSIGIQTFSDKGRLFLGRRGSGLNAVKLLEKLRDKFEVVSVDIIYNYPNQSIEDLMYDLDVITKLDLSGFSMYSLMAMGKIRKEIIDEFNDKLFYKTILDVGRKNSFQLLEVTKMVKNDRYRYIINRFNGMDTLGIGAGAGGNLENFVYMNPPVVERYQKIVDRTENRNGMLFDNIYTKLEILKGSIQMGKIPISNELLKSSEQVQIYIDKLIDEGYASEEGKLTDEGLYFANNISNDIFRLISNTLKLSKNKIAHFKS